MRRRLVSRVGIVLLVFLLFAACSTEGDAGSTTTTAAPEPSTTAPATPPAMEDGDWFAFVEVGRNETDAIVLGVDLAEFLTGEEARQAAIEAGVIGDDEDLPNDFFIVNDEERFELLPIAEGAQFALISGNDTSQQVIVDADVFAGIYETGTYDEPVYGIPGGVPVAMTVTVADGAVTGAEAFYLP